MTPSPSLVVKVILLILALLVLLAGAQTPDTPQVCETVVRDLHTQLVTDQILPPLPTATWYQQLTSLGKELRLTLTQLALERQQQSQVKRSLAEMAEQARDMQQRLQQLSTALEQARAAPVSPTN